MIRVALLEPLSSCTDACATRSWRRPSGEQLEALAAVDRDDAGDTIYAIDVVAEAIVTRFADALAREHAFVLVAEGCRAAAAAIRTGATRRRSTGGSSSIRSTARAA